MTFAVCAEMSAVYHSSAGCENSGCLLNSGSDEPDGVHRELLEIVPLLVRTWYLLRYLLVGAPVISWWTYLLNTNAVMRR